MRISDWSSDVCSSDLSGIPDGRDGIVVDVDALDEGDVILPLVDVTLLPTKLDRTGLVIRGEGALPFGVVRQADLACAIDRDRPRRRARELPLVIGQRRQAELSAQERKAIVDQSEEHTSELQSLMRISYAVFCLKKKKTNTTNTRRSI